MSCSLYFAITSFINTEYIKVVIIIIIIIIIITKFIKRTNSSKLDCWSQTCLILKGRLMFIDYLFI